MTFKGIHQNASTGLSVCRQTRWTGVHSFGNYLNYKEKEMEEQVSFFLFSLCLTTLGFLSVSISVKLKLSEDRDGSGGSGVWVYMRGSHSEQWSDTSWAGWLQRLCQLSAVLLRWLGNRLLFCSAHQAGRAAGQVRTVSLGLELNLTGNRKPLRFNF